MARPVQPLGTFGLITVRRTSRGYVALTRFREQTGAYRRVTATGESRAAAENLLKEKIAAGLPSRADGDLNGQTKIRAVAEVWIREIEQRQDHAPQTTEVYRDIVNRIILPGIGDLRLGELTVGTLDRFLKTEAARGLSRGRHARVVLPRSSTSRCGTTRCLATRSGRLRRCAGPLGDPVIEPRGAHRDSPAASRAPPRTRTPRTVARRTAGADLRRSCSVHLPGSAKRSQSAAATSIWTPSSRPSRSPARSFSSEARATFANLTPSTRSTGEPSLSRASPLMPCASDWPPPETSTPEQTVFRTKQGTPLSPANVRRLWRSIRDASAGLLPEGMDLAQVVPHTLRKTVATALDDAAGTDLAANVAFVDRRAPRAASRAGPARHPGARPPRVRHWPPLSSTAPAPPGSDWAADPGVHGCLCARLLRPWRLQLHASGSFVSDLGCSPRCPVRRRGAGPCAPELSRARAAHAPERPPRRLTASGDRRRTPVAVRGLVAAELSTSRLETLNVPVVASSSSPGWVPACRCRRC